MALFESASLVVTPNGTKASKLYSVKPADGSGDMTVTRATTATRVNASGIIESVSTNVPRLDYTGSTCPSILIEPQRTNLVVYSEQFDNASWAKTAATVTANSIISPDGTQDADTFSGNGVLGTHFLVQSGVSSVTSGLAYTTSFYAKKNTNNFIQIVGSSSPYGGNNVWANYDLNLGLVGSVGTSCTATIQSVGNGWYRCTMTATAVSTTNASIYILGLISSATSLRGETNTLNTSVYLWGAQLEAGSTATSYIPTTTSTVTRNADSINKTGISSLLGQTEGSVYSEFYWSGPKVETCSIFSLSTDTANYFTINLRGTGLAQPNRLAPVIAKTGEASITRSDGPTISAGLIKLCVVYSLSENLIKMYVNGSLYLNFTSLPFFPSVNRFAFGSSQSNGSFFTDEIKSTAIWKTRLTDAECITLTTI